MGSDDKKRQKEKKKQQQKNRGKNRDLKCADVENGDSGSSTPVLNGGAPLDVEELDEVTKQFNKIELEKADNRAVTGVLHSQPQSCDLKIGGLSISNYGKIMLEDTELDLANGHRYGLLGVNGCGKSTLLSVLGFREVPIPEHIDTFLLQREMPATRKTALQCVLEVDNVRRRLEAEAEQLATMADDEEAHERLMMIYDRLDSMDASKAEARAAELLSGLGFTQEMQHKMCKDFSGGWRMRIALARCLYMKPSMLLLDEPTNHLDLDACVWLEEELKTFNRILIVVSHSQDFLNGVCTNIIHMQNNQLKVYGGNYDQYMATRADLEVNQMKRFQSEQDQIAHMKNYIARFGHGSAKLARQAQSKEKTLSRMVDRGLTEKVSGDKTLQFCFPSCGKIPPPVIMVQDVSFRYSDDTPWIYQHLEFGMDLDTRVALVGPNGAGKSTLLKILAGELSPTSGMVRRHSHLKISRYHQHSTEILDFDMSPIDWMLQQFPLIKERDDMRKILGRYGVTGSQQTCPIKNLSDGQKCRIMFGWIANQVPHMLLMDEPTNHLDIETIDSLADAINDFEGGLVLVSHDFRLISQVCEEVWECDKGTAKKWPGDIFSYKQTLVNKVRKFNEGRGR